VRRADNSEGMEGWELCSPVQVCWGEGGQEDETAGLRDSKSAGGGENATPN